MKKRKNIMVRIVAFIALISIIIGVLGTGALFIYESFAPTLPPEELWDIFIPSSDTSLDETDIIIPEFQWDIEE